MRNLKRALSLTLASVMLLGMMVMGSSAAGFPDVDEEDNVEAIEVIQAVGVMVGDDNGNFNPDSQVTRAQMAVVMAKLMNLNTYITGSNPFNDVPDWAEASVSACYANGIVSGYGDGRYGSDDPVTAVQAASMLMRALGYFQYAEDYKDGFELATIRQAGRIDLFNGAGTSTATENLTRNQVAQLVLNTLKSGMVEADDGNKVNVNVSGVQVSVGATNYVYVTSRESYAKAIRDDTYNGGNAGSSATGDTTGLYSNYIVDLGEKLYQGDLKRQTSGITDGFRAPATRWSYKNVEVGIYADAADYVFEGEVKSNAMYAQVGKTVAEQYSWAVYVDGALAYDLNDIDDGPATIFGQQDVADNDNDTLGGTKRGTVTSVYLDNSPSNGYSGHATVTIVHTYAAEIAQVKDGKVTLSDGNLTYETTDYEDGQIVLFTKSHQNNDNNWTVEQILGLAPHVEGTATTIRDDDRVIIDDETYFYNYRFNADGGDRLQAESVDHPVAFYLDNQKNIIRIDEAVESYDYAYVNAVGHDSGQYNWQKPTYGAELVMTDGTIRTVILSNATVDKYKNAPSPSAEGDEEATETELDKDPTLKALKENLEGQIVAYREKSSNNFELDVKTSDDGGYTISGETANLKIVENGAARIQKEDGTYIYTNANTVFLIRDMDDDDVSDFKVYVGFNNVPDVKAHDGAKIVWYKGEHRSAAGVVVIDGGEVTGSVNDVIYVIGGPSKRAGTGNNIYWVFDAVVNGESTTLEVLESSSAYDDLIDTAEMAKGKVAVFFGMSQDSNGRVERLTKTVPTDVEINESNIPTVIPAGGENKDGVFVYDMLAAGKYQDGYVWFGTGRISADALGFGRKTSSSTYEYQIAADKDTEIVYRNADGTRTTSSYLMTNVTNSAIVITEKGIAVSVLVWDRENADVPPVQKGQTDVTVIFDEGVKSVTVDGQKVTKTDTQINVDKDTELDVTVELNADYEITTVNGSKSDTEFTMTFTTSSELKIVTNKEGEEPEVALNVVLDPNCAAAKAGVTIAGTHIVTSGESGDANSPWSGKTANALYVTLKMPSSDVSLGTCSGAKLTYQANGGLDLEAAATKDGTMIKVTSANTLDDSLTYTLTGVDVVTKHNVVFDKTAVSGLSMTSTTLQIGEDGTTDDTLKLNITAGLPANAAEVKVVYKVEPSLAGGTLDGAADEGDDAGYMVSSAITTANGKFDDAWEIVGDNAKVASTAGDVTVTIKEVRVTKILATVEGAYAASDAAITITCDGTTQWTLPDLTLNDAPDTTIVNEMKADITLTGVTADTSGEEKLEAQGVTVASGLVGLAAGTHKYTCDGKNPVVITVTPKVTKLETTAFGVSGNGATGISAGAAVAIADGANSAKITLTVASTNKFTDTKYTVIEVVSGATAGLKFYSTEAASGSNDTSQTVEIDAGALTGITGDKKITFKVSEIAEIPADA